MDTFDIYSMFLAKSLKLDCRKLKWNANMKVSMLPTNTSQVTSEDRNQSRTFF